MQTLCHNLNQFACKRSSCHMKSAMQDVLALKSIIETRIYGIKNKDAGEIWGMNVQKLTDTWLKYSGTLSLIGNFMNDAINVSVAKAANFLEALGGEHYNLANLANAKKKYWSDTKGLIDDYGTTVDKARTNLFMNQFNVMGSKAYTDGSFAETTRAQKLFKLNTTRFISNFGEHWHLDKLELENSKSKMK